MAVLKPKKLQDFLDKLSGPSKNCFLEHRSDQSGHDRNEIRRAWCLRIRLEEDANCAVYVSLSSVKTRTTLGGGGFMLLRFVMFHPYGPVAQLVRAHA